MYRLDNSFTDHGSYAFYWVVIAGCGGTGGFAADGLSQTLPQNARLLLVDNDRVEERNLIRQNFTRDEVGERKSRALALRLTRRYGRAIAYSTRDIKSTETDRSGGIVIGCVDNGMARQDIEEKFTGGGFVWWIDAGNGENFGQILIGNSKDAEFMKDICLQLPLPTIQRPELLAQVPAVESCADIPDQGPTINRVMGALLTEVTRRLIAGTCPWMQLLLDMQMGEVHPVMAAPETAGKILKR